MTASSQASTSLQPYGSRVGNFAKNAAARNILETMERKQSNLCVSVDVTKKKDLLDIVDAVGEAVIMVKKHDFVIFEDRKFADIGNTVSLQYAAGVHKIASWSDITNAHLVPGTGIIDGLAKVGEPLGRGLLLLAEMSSKGTLAAGEYTRANVEAAYNNESGFVMGFIAMGRVDDKYAPADKPKRDFLVLTLALVSMPPAMQWVSSTARLTKSFTSRAAMSLSWAEAFMEP
ncbi:hypothetical protein L7F22_022585 [Adiantum nelumboides]|nr:hypothetical protein [Adiantum nelumboides]